MLADDIVTSCCAALEPESLIELMRKRMICDASNKTRSSHDVGDAGGCGLDGLGGVCLMLRVSGVICERDEFSHVRRRWV